MGWGQPARWSCSANWGLLSPEEARDEEDYSRNGYVDPADSRLPIFSYPGQGGDVGEQWLAICVPGDGNPGCDRTRGDGEHVVCAIYCPHQVQRSAGGQEAAVHYCEMVGCLT